MITLKQTNRSKIKDIMYAKCKTISLPKLVLNVQISKPQQYSWLLNCSILFITENIQKVTRSNDAVHLHEHKIIKEIFAHSDGVHAPSVPMHPDQVTQPPMSSACFYKSLLRYFTPTIKQ